MEMKFEEFVLWRDSIRDHWISMGLTESMANLFNLFLLSASVFVLGWLLKLVTQRIFIKLLERIIQKSKTRYDDFIIERKVLHRAAHMVPALVIYGLSDVAFQGFETLMEMVLTISELYILFVFLWVIHSSVSVLEDIYNTFPNAAERPIKGYIQVLHIFVWFIGALISVSILFDVELTAVFASLGAVAAVLLLIFKDTILGLVAGIQLSANKMLKIGDWISMPSHNADGSVVEITLNTVKVLNGDKTITTIPTYALVSGSFANFKGLEESGARRIKRSVNVDMNSIAFASPDLLTRVSKNSQLSAYLEEKTAGRKITNLGLFMKYIEIYLKNHPRLRQDLTLVVRQLQPSASGMPIEVYAYCSDYQIEDYENVQSEIFDFIIATMNEFDLRVFQNLGGHDMNHLVHSMIEKH